MKKLSVSVLLMIIAVSSFAKTYGYMLRPNGPLREDKGNGGAEWSITVPEGTELEVESAVPVKMTLKTEKEDIPDISFYKVEYEGNTYYARDTEVAIGGIEIALILEDTTLFRKAEISSFMNAKIERNSLVVAGMKKEYAGTSFTEIQYWSAKGNEIRRRYVFTDKVSTNSKDIEAVNIVARALSLKNQDPAKERTMRQELFNNAMSLNTSESVTVYVQEEYNKLYGEIDIEPFYGTIVSPDGSKINVRKSPVNGEVTGQVENGWEILVYKKSAEVSEIEGVKDCWYYVQELGGMKEGLAKGWVFGKYVLFTISEKEASIQAAGGEPLSVSE